MICRFYECLWTFSGFTAFMLTNQSGKKECFLVNLKVNYVSQLWARIMQQCNCEGWGKKMHVVAFKRKHQSSLWEHCRESPCFNTTVRGEVDLTFEESPNGLKLTLSDVAQHMGHGPWHQKNQGSALASDLAQDHRYPNSLQQSNISSPGRYFENFQYNKLAKSQLSCAQKMYVPSYVWVISMGV